MLNRRALNVALGLSATLALCGTALAQEVYIPLEIGHQFVVGREHAERRIVGAREPAVIP